MYEIAIFIKKINMAIKLTNKTRTSPPDSSYEFGRIKDDSSSGSNDGTPINTLVYGDFHQFFEKLMFDSGVLHNNLPESTLNGHQLNSALSKLIKDIIVASPIYANIEPDDIDLNTNSIFNPYTNLIPLPNDSKTRIITVFSSCNWERVEQGGATSDFDCEMELLLNGSIIDSARVYIPINFANTRLQSVCMKVIMHNGDGGDLGLRFHNKMLSGSDRAYISKIKLFLNGHITYP